MSTGMGMGPVESGTEIYTVSDVRCRISAFTVANCHKAEFAPVHIAYVEPMKLPEKWRYVSRSSS